MGCLNSYGDDPGVYDQELVPGHNIRSYYFGNLVEHFGSHPHTHLANY